MREGGGREGVGLRIVLIDSYLGDRKSQGKEIGSQSGSQWPCSGFLPKSLSTRWKGETQLVDFIQLLSIPTLHPYNHCKEIKCRW